MILDLLLIVILIVAIIKGYQRGLIVGIFSFIAVIIGLAAAIKLSAPFRITSRPDRLGELDGHVEALLAAFGKERCIWGSDWPFLGLSHDIRYGDAMAALQHWLPDEADRDLVLRRNPARLLGFPS